MTAYSNGLCDRVIARHAAFAFLVVIITLLYVASPSIGSEAAQQKEFEILNDRSAAMNARGRFQEALEAAEQALSLHPNYSLAWNNKSVALIGLQRFSEAIEAVDRALEADPLNSSAWTNKALIYRQTKRLDEALKAMDRAVLIDDKNPLVWYNKACYQALNKDRTGALESLTRAVALDPKLKRLATKDSDFDTLREDPEFKKLMRK